MKNLKQVTYKISILILLVFLAGCSVSDMKFIGYENQNGNLIINLIESTQNRTVYPENISLDVQSYDISGIGPQDEIFSALGVTSSTYSQSSLAVGLWNITVKAKNSDGDIIGEGDGFASVTEGVSTEVNVTINPALGIGELNIQMSWPSSLTNPSIFSEVTYLDGTDQTEDAVFTISGTSGSLTKSYNSGYYRLIIKLKENGASCWGIMETVYILKGSISRSVYALTEDSINMKPEYPTGLSIVSLSENSISINWIDNSLTEEGVVVERSDNGGAYSQIASLASDTISYTDDSVSVDNDYAYRIKAYNHWGDSQYSEILAVSTKKTGSPQFSVLAGDYSYILSIKITSATPGATIRYTLDESEPTLTNGILYSDENEIVVSSSKTLKAIAYKVGFLNSVVVEAIYNITTEEFYSEDFESGNLSGWTLSGNGLPAITSEVKYSGTYSATLNPALYSTYKSVLEKSVSVVEDAIISFYIKTDTCNRSDSNHYKFYIDGVLQNVDNSWKGTIDWTIVDFPISSGNHTLKWEFDRAAGYYFTGTANCVWLDRIKIIPDTVFSLEFTPKAPQKAIRNSTVLNYACVAKRQDGSVKEDSVVSYTVLPLTGSGNITIDGDFTGASEGFCKIMAQSGEIVAYSYPIEILPSNYLDLPFIYNGASYNGKTSAGSGSPVINVDSGIQVTSPVVSTFEADGFFTIKGSNSYTLENQFTCFYIVKDGQTATYLLRKNFDSRIWLKYGTGTYNVYVYKATATVNNLNYEGDTQHFSTSTLLYKFTVTNTRDEYGQFLYPSDYSQSDDIVLQNKAVELTYNLTNEDDKIKAIYDFVVKRNHYDFDSTNEGQRKKQDALSVFNNQMGVCEGYTMLFTALARANGIQTKIIYGLAVTQTGNVGHAWNNILYQNSLWKFVDSTWGDPVPNDTDPNSVTYKYYMLDDMTGIGGDHIPSNEGGGRSVGNDF